MIQDDLNDQIQERLRALQADIQVLVAFSIGVIETHPDREKLRKQFAFHYETLHGRWLNSEIAEDFLTEAAAIRDVLDSSFERTRP
ncbi:hypothetical protein [Zoogloea sp.]|uniref:hypothetical protein n=1 Tax=Zoogloea sp. TaxID=49181 RepID=UPI0025F0C936|nr:hypothetical protein [Zoogloea sp.]MCK6396037.1 hypothetical protein [Zoogloea sp.]